MLTVVFIVLPMSLLVLNSKSPPGAQTTPLAPVHSQAECDLEYHRCMVSFCTITNRFCQQKHPKMRSSLSVCCTERQRTSACSLRPVLHDI